MFSPKLYQVRKVPAIEIIKSNYNLKIRNEDYTVNQQDNMLFRQLRIITGVDKPFVSEIIFVDCNGARSKKEAIREIVINGFYVN